MIDAGTINARLVLDTAPFSNGIDKALSSISLLGLVSGEQGGRISSLGELLASCGSSVTTEFSYPFRAAALAMNDSCATVLGAVVGTARRVQLPAQMMKDNLIGPLRDAANKSTGIMSDFGQGLINGLDSKHNKLISKAKKIANSVAAAMKKTLGIASPSKVMREVGQFTAEGLALGLEDMDGRVGQASSLLARNTVNSYAQGNPAENGGAGVSNDAVMRRLDILIDILSNGRQNIQLDRRSFGTLVREYM